MRVLKQVLALGLAMGIAPAVWAQGAPPPGGSSSSSVTYKATYKLDGGNVTALTDSVNGYVVANQSTARANIEPLQVGYFFDAVESDDVLKFVKRGGASAVTIPEADIDLAVGSSIGKMRQS